MVRPPDLEGVGQQLFDHLVEDAAVGGQPLGGQGLDRVVEDEEGAVLDEVGGRLDRGQQGREQLRPLAGHIESGMGRNEML